MIRTAIRVASVLVVLLTSLAQAQSTAPTQSATRRSVLDIAVDPRVELTCIIFQLAGNPEYSQPRVPAYAKDVQAHFASFKDHELVRLARRLRSSRGVGFDAPMSLAVHLKDIQSLDGVVPLDPLPAQVDKRWRPEDVRQFQQLARRFVAESKFEDFLAAHRDLYDQSAARMRRTIEEHANLAWFDQFFGERPAARFHLVIGLLNGPSNYGVRTVVGGGEELYCILGAWTCDARGIPQFSAEIVPTVVHEFNHSYVNPLVEKYLPEMRAAGQTLFERNERLMRRQAYASGQTVLAESLVRACVVRYRYANEGTAAGVAEVLRQQALGFAWTGELSALLADYEQNRHAYPALEQFMPRVVRFFNDYVASLPP
ncbi:DUF4932 domain-containing protein [Fontivita pretiosa]|uniref:DUF4932 domain-containing protein n=1 Tax=Fontivita pretiosa TaxID=2989684 RepID=UPI003D17A0B3